MRKRLYNQPITLDEVKAKIAEKVIIDPISSCWEWQGAYARGYGEIKGRAKKFTGEGSVHRASFVVYNGEIPEGYLVRHRCNNAKCCNPEHLELGTHSDNSFDKFEALEQRSTAALIMLKRQLEAKLEFVNKIITGRA